jgi:uncharacterized protein YndB with AHSA1/START domain
MTNLLYAGPSLETLYAEYATQGRIDTRAPVTASRDVVIAAPVATVWALLSDPHGWGRIDPAIHDVRLDAGVRPGTRFTWRNGRARIRSRFAVVDPEREITWIGVSSGAKAVHRHLLAAPDGAHTHLVSEESMAAPLLPLFFSNAKLAAALGTWLTAIKTTAERTGP